MNLHANVMEQLEQLTGEPADRVTLNRALRLLAKWRSELIQSHLIQQHGLRVMQGPLSGLELIAEPTKECLIPKILGCYEQPLQPHIIKALRARYHVILNIGCAEGYYAVGMARLLPHTRVLAYDLDLTAQVRCRELAAKNGVSDQVKVGSLFQPQDFAGFYGQHTLVLCDVDGNEAELLDPAKAPALEGMDLIVESHECLVPGITKQLIERFSPTHFITVVHDDGQRRLDQAPDWFNNLAHLDQLLATWEWRAGPTPWLVMKAKG